MRFKNWTPSQLGNLSYFQMSLLGSSPIDPILGSWASANFFSRGRKEGWGPKTYFLLRKQRKRFFFFSQKKSKTYYFWPAMGAWSLALLPLLRTPMVWMAQCILIPKIFCNQLTLWYSLTFFFCKIPFTCLNFQHFS